MSLTNKVEVTLTPPVLQAELADDLEGFDVQGGIEDGDARTVSKTGEKAILKFEGIDLSSVSAIVFDGKSSSSGAIHLVLDADFGNINSTVSFEEGQTMKLNLNESGIHDLYFIFESDGDLTINELQFNLFTR